MPERTPGGDTKPKCNTNCPPPKPPSILLEAEELIHGERRSDYGPVEESFKVVAEVWSGLLRRKLQEGCAVTASDVAVLMAGFKLCREQNAAKHDNRLDAAGYIGLLDQIVKATQTPQ